MVNFLLLWNFFSHVFARWTPMSNAVPMTRSSWFQRPRSQSRLDQEITLWWQSVKATLNSITDIFILYLGGSTLVPGAVIKDVLPLLEDQNEVEIWCLYTSNHHCQFFLRALTLPDVMHRLWRRRQHQWWSNVLPSLDLSLGAFETLWGLTNVRSAIRNNLSILWTILVPSLPSGIIQRRRQNIG